MSSVTSTTFSLRAQDALAWDPLKAVRPIQEPQSPPPQAAPAASPLTRASFDEVPSTVAMRFEFNAMTHAWMLAMIDSQSGEVVRKIKVVNPPGNGGLHQSGQWIDRVV